MAPDVRTGGRLGGFRIEETLGTGAMGTVYLAREETTGRAVALKVLSPELARDDRFRQRFLREVELAQQLAHPNIVATLRAGEDDGVLFLAMEHVPGRDLRELLRAEHALEPARAVDLLAQVAAALDAAHDAGLVHRDVKPANVLLSGGADGEHARICDFGLARHVSSVGSLTGERGFVGTIDYVAPEQIEGGPVDGRADVYALGCILFECLTGERPFGRESELAVVFAHLNEAPPRSSEVRPELPAAFDDVFATALAKAPDDRFATCGELAAAARAALAGRPFPRRRPLSTRRLLVAAALVCGAAAAALAVALSGGGSAGGRVRAAPPLTLRPNAVTVLDPARHLVVARTPLASPSVYDVEATDLVFAGGAAWAVMPGRQRLVRIDLRTRTTRKIQLPWQPGPRLAFGGGLVWADEDTGTGVAGVDPRTARIVRRFTVPGRNEGGLAFGGGSLWIAHGDGVVRVDPRDGRVELRVPNPGQAEQTVWLAYADGAVWTARASGVVRKIDPVAGRITWTAHLDGYLSDLAVGDGSVWVSVAPAGILYRLSEDDLSVLAPLRIGGDPERITLSGHRLWVANGAPRTVSVVDLDSGSRRVLPVSAQPTVARFERGRVWTAAQPSPQPLPAIAGPELRIAAPQSIDLDPLDSHSVLDEQRLYATCANLLAYPDAAGARGAHLRPELASALPVVSHGGRRYTFRVRRGFRFSPPSNQAVTAETIRFTVERALSPNVSPQSSPTQFLGDVEGAAAFRAGRARHVSGIAVRGATISFTLVRPAGDFPARLASGYACPVPIGTPPPDGGGPPRPLASDGPYYVASNEGDRTVLLRNPNYHGGRPRRPERIVYTDDIPTQKAAALADAGALDYVPDGGPPLELGGAVERAYGAGSAAARGGKERYFREPMPWEDGLVLNASRPLFADLRMRRAVNLALDRTALARAFADDPSDEIVPPAVVGFRPGSVYPLRPNLRAARALTGGRRRHALLWYCINGVFGSPAQGRIAQLIRSELAQIRIDVSITRSNCAQDFRYDATSRRADLIMFSSGSPQRDPARFFSWVLDGRSYGAALGRGLWSEASFRRRVAAAAALGGATRTHAYAQLVRELMLAAPYAVYGSFAGVEYFSPHVGCKVFQRAGGFVDLGALCVPRR